MITKIQEDLVQAMRDKDYFKMNVLRAVKSAITNASLQKGNINEVLSDTEILGIIRKQISQRQDSVEAYVNAQRHDLLLIETNEIEILNKYLPVEIPDAALETIIVEVILDLNATSKKDMGKVIKGVVEQVNGRADNKRISKMVGDKLQ